MSTVDRTANDTASGLSDDQGPAEPLVLGATGPRDAADDPTPAEEGRRPQSNSRRAELHATPPGVSGPAINEYANQHLAVIDDLIRQLQAAASSYRQRRLDWDDVATLRIVRERLSGDAKNLSASEAAAAARRAARQVSTEIRRLA
jgi:hypothetical protein